MSTTDLANTESKKRLLEQTLKDLILKANSESCDKSYALFLRTISPCLRGYFRKRMYARPDDVEDLLQEVLLAIHNKRHTYKPEYPVTAWAHGIARYKLIDYFRQSNHTADHIDIEDAEELLWQDDTDAQDANRDVMQVLESLPEKQKQVIQWVKLEGRSIAETALLSGQSESLVKVNIHRGLKKLATLLTGNKDEN